MSKVIVITGGTMGLGSELCKIYKSSSTVIILGRSANDLNENEYKCDVTNSKQIAEVFEKIKNKYKHIDILINNAGVGMSGISELIDEEKIKNIFDVNFFGLVNCTKCALPLMNNGAKIINISSAMAYFPMGYRSYYASVKSAVNTLTLAWRSELKPLGIDMFAIAPGDIKTNFTSNRNKDFTTNDRYGSAMINATKKVDAREDKRMNAEKVGKIIAKIINKKHHKPVYIIGAKYKFLHFASRFVPISWLMKGIENFTMK